MIQQISAAHLSWFRSLSPRRSRPNRQAPRRRLAVEVLEDRLVPAGNLLVTVAGPYPQHLFREYTPTGSLVRAVNIPPTPGNTFDYARGLVEDPTGKVYIYDGTFTPYLAAYNPQAATWSQTTYAGWSTVSNISYGGLGLFQNFVYASDMATGGAMPNGIVRFDTVANTATRFGSGTDFTKVTVGLDNNVYALASQKVYVFNPITMAQLRVVTLPSGDYRGIAVSAGGDIFAAAWNNVISHFNSGGTLLQSVTLNSSNGAPFMFNWPDDIAIAPDGTLAIGSFSGHIVQMTSAFTNISYIDTGTSNAVFVTFTPQQAPPLPTISVSDTSVVEGNAGLGGPMAQFMLTLSTPSSQTVLVNYATADGTAKGGALAPNSPFDYNSMSGTIGFAPGATTQVVAVPIYGDTLYEGNENFYLNLSQPVNATLARAQGTCTIIDDDPLPSIAVGDVTVTSPTSGNTWASFPITLSNGAGMPITVSYSTANGTATAGTDYQGAVNGTLTIPAGVTQTYVSLQVYGDPYWDPAETFTLTLSHPSLGTLGRAQATATINSSLPWPTISVSNVTVTNVASGTTPATFTVRLSEPLSDPVQVYYATADISATAGSDYQAASGTLNFAPGQTSQNVSVNVIGDPLYDAPEIFNLNLLPMAGGSPFASGTATIVSGVPQPSVSVNDATVQNTASGATATFTVSLSAASGQTVTVGYSTASGTATPGADYQSISNTLTFAPGQTSQTVTVNVIGDPYYDGTETFNLNLLNPSGATLARWQGTGTILSALPPPTISVSNVTVTNPTSGLTPATFTVSLSEPLSDPTSVAYTTADGTASAGNDYQSISGMVNFSPGQTSQTVTVNVIGDPLYDDPETFNLNLVPFAGGAPYASGTATIVSSLAQPTLSVSNDTVTNGTSGTTPMPFTVTLSAASGGPVTVSYATADGTAVAGADYQAASGTLTFAPGQTSQTITVNAIGNPLYAPTRTFTVNLSGATGATLAQAQGTGTIVNSQAPPYVNIGGVYVTDVDSGTTPANFYVWLSPGSSVPVTVDYTTVAGTAVAGTDYVAASGTLTFAPGQISQYITVSVIGNPVYAPGRTLSVVLSNPQNARMGSQGGNCTIFDDAPLANIGPDTTVNEGSTVQFDASGSRALDGEPLTFTWTFGDGSTGTGTQPTHAYADNGVYTATVSVSDGTAVSTATETVTVLNVPPTVTISGPADAVPGQDRTFTLSAADPSPVDQAAGFTYQVTWGDGTTQTLQGAGSSVQVDHIFTATGPYSVYVTATDKDGGAGGARQLVQVVATELQGGDLFVGGTTGDDVITVQPADTIGTVDVVINGQDQGTFVPTGQVVVYGQAGNDVIQVVPLSANGVTTPLALPVMLFGGDGDDTLDARGASGPAVLVGGAGNDTLYGGSGRNILIGGTGSDVLHGGVSDDVLIGGTTSYDASLTALAALRAEWARTDADYLTRISHLDGTQSGGLNGSYLLNNQTVFGDGAGNDLYGDQGQDWFFAAAGGANPDRLHDLETGETVTNL